MPQPSAILQALLTSLTGARQGTTLTLDAATLGETSAAALLDLFSYELQITSFSLGNVSLPSSVTGTDLAVSGSNGTVTLDLTFEDALGEVAIEALFHAPEIAALRQAFRSLPDDFFDAIEASGATATVSAPGLVQPLTLTGARYGIVGLVTPDSGLVTTSIAPRVEGQATPDGSKELLVEAPTAMSGYRMAPLAGTWTFSDLSWLMPGLGLLAAFPDIIGTENLSLRGFDLNLDPDAPGLSSISLDVANAADPAKPLWTAADGKVELTDVIVALDLSYSADHSLSVPRTGSLQGNFRVGSMVMNVQIPFPPTGIWSLTAYPDVLLPTLSDIASLVNGGSSALGTALPAQLGDVSGFELSYLRLAVNGDTLSLAEFTVGLTSTGRWPLIPGVVELESLQISLTIDGTPSVTGRVIGTVQLPGGASILVSLGRSTPHELWRLDAISPAIALPSLGQLTQLTQNEDLGSLVKAGRLNELHFVMTDLNFGLTLGPAKLTNLGLTLQLADTTDAAHPLTPVLDWPLIPGILTLTQFSFGFQITWADTVTKDVFGRFVLNGLEFDIRFARQTTAGASTDALIAEYSAQGAAGTINVKDLIHSIAPDAAADVPDGVTIDLADAVLAYLNTDKPKFLFAMDIAVELPISDLPLVGKALPADATVAVKNLKVVVASAGMSATDVAEINGMSRKPVLAPPSTDARGDAIPAGFSMTAELQLGSLTILMTSPPAKQRSQQLPSLPAVPLAAPAPDPVMWITVQKTFGPVTIQKVGFSYRSGGLFVVANLSLSVGGLEIDLLGFGVGSPIKDPRPEFTIDGIAVTWAEGPVEVSGALTGSIAPVVDLSGELIVGAGQLQIAAVGGYCEVDQHPSLFAYAVLDYPIGGPAFFFVTGLAGGFGFNRSLVIPPVDRVADFPFVQWSQGQGNPPPMGSNAVAAVIGELSSSGVVAPSVGEHWVAAGVRFTSFELVRSFALLTVVFGTTFEVALLGLSTVQLPPPPAAPIARAELELKAAYLPDSGLLSVSGQLTAQSFVLSTDCHLTGGFALATWFHDDPHTGARAGEFVLTLGGYSPRFTPPGYYPVVPRLGLRWQISPELTVAGDLYFALTSSAVMAGGGLSAVWQSGNIRAWFDMEADFLLVFEPFHYYLSAAIQIGASFTIDLLFTSFAVTIHLGVALEIWGPDFTGRVTVDLSIISFTISFGSSKPDNAKTIEWPDFVGRLIPRTPAPALAATGDDQGIPAVVQIAVQDGLLKRLSDADGELNWIVDGAALRITTQTAIPVNNWSLTSNLTLIHDGPAPNTDFGVGPVGLANGELTSTHAVTLTGAGAFHASHILSNVPAALWHTRTLDDHGVPTDVDPLHSTTVNGVATGLAITPAPIPPDHTLAITIENLDYTVAEPRGTFTWSDATAPLTDPFTPQDVWATITAPGPTAVRSALTTSVAAAGYPVPARIEVSELATPTDYDLTAAPVLRLLGEQR